MEENSGSHVELICRRRWLIVRFREPQETVSWAVLGGGRRRSHGVAWYQVRRDELPPAVIPHDFMRERLNAEGLHNVIGLLTSHPVDRFSDVEKRGEQTRARCIATVGLKNALRVGDPARGGAPAGTINLLCWISRPLAEGAMLEVLSLAAEARTAAMLESGIPSTLSGRPATGTGTDCVVIASPPPGFALDYVGKHTPVGSLLGSAVFEAVHMAIEQWKREYHA